MRRTAFTLAVVGLFAACGFPEVGYDGGTDAGGVDVTSNPDAPTGAEGSTGDDARLDGTTGEASDATGDVTSAADVTPDGGGDSSTVPDTAADGPATDADATADGPAESDVLDSSSDGSTDAPPDASDAGTDAPLVCDFDLDTYKAKGAACAGNDCCDTDNKAHPGQTMFFTQPDACGSYDYNCDGQITPQYAVNITCGGTGLTGCTGGSAFVGDPGCGNSGLYATCVPNGVLACQKGNQITVTQGCN